MALYAFDGTWNRDKAGNRKDTNVVKFSDAYIPGGSVCYQEGVGVRFGPLGKVVGGLTGAGGRTRLRRAWNRLLDNLEEGDATVDIVGFSRGAALALEFAEWIARKRLRGACPRPKVRFLGLWDTVHSFGVPGNNINLGWAMNLPGSVEKCFHALALDEMRRTFPPTRLAARVDRAQQEGRLYEVWFRGVHSDVGGGNGNQGLSDIALHWMFRRGLATGLRFREASVGRALRRMDPQTPISVHALDPIQSGFRVVRWNDLVHASVSPRADDGARRHNDPPIGLQRVDDDGALLPLGFGEA
ncbi:MAG TPA: DUF2235 domain-containing protein [Candidatus Polarisedimenticolia bacterium]|nr:DUF2235 domain-containing protein [Candidatus Polarisedimenticolia bacterium]